MRLAGILSRLSRATRIRRRVVRWGRRDKGPIQPLPPIDGLSIRRVGEEDRERLCQVGPIEMDDLRERLARGDWGYLATLDGRPAGYCWIQFSGVHRVSQAGIDRAIPPGENMVYNGRTAEFARGQRVYPLILVRILEDLFSAGHMSAWGYVNSDNEASMRGLAKLGFTYYGEWKALHLSYWVIPLGRS